MGDAAPGGGKVVLALDASGRAVAASDIVMPRRSVAGLDELRPWQGKSERDSRSRQLIYGQTLARIVEPAWQVLRKLGVAAPSCHTVAHAVPAAAGGIT